ncbi:MAG: nucleoside triphosphate pyrophosphohydrolase [Rhodococcus sp. (in: high G+C Gram-positive bacteria)]
MGKLVRDLIPEIIEATGRTPVTRVLDDDEYRMALQEKLVEEAAELRDATDADRAEELADVWEVVHALASDMGLTPAALARLAARKRAERGAFVGRIWLE